jgi:hypothetical protein
MIESGRLAERLPMDGLVAMIRPWGWLTIWPGHAFHKRFMVIGHWGVLDGLTQTATAWPYFAIGLAAHRNFLR